MECRSSFFLIKLVLLHWTTVSTGLFHSRTTKLVRKFFVQSDILSSIKKFWCFHQSQTVILKHSIRFPWSIRVPGGTRWREESVPSWVVAQGDVLEEIIFAAIFETPTLSMMSTCWGDQNCTAYSKWSRTKLLQWKYYNFILEREVTVKEVKYTSLRQTDSTNPENNKWARNLSFHNIFREKAKKRSEWNKRKFLIASEHHGRV